MGASYSFGTDKLVGVPLRFDRCDTPNTAWVLGQLNAMGRVHDERQMFRATLSVADPFDHHISTEIRRREVVFRVAGVESFHRIVKSHGEGMKETGMLRVKGIGVLLKGTSTASSFEGCILEMSANMPGKTVADRITLFRPGNADDCDELRWWPEGSVLFNERFLCAAECLIFTSDANPDDTFDRPAALRIIRDELKRFTAGHMAEILLDQMLLMGLGTVNRDDSISVLKRSNAYDLFRNLGAKPPRLVQTVAVAR